MAARTPGAHIDPVRPIARPPHPFAESIPTIDDVVNDPALFSPHFRDRESWQPWRSFNKVLFGLPLNDDDLALYRACTGRYEPPLERAIEAWIAVGRRGGKSRNVALIAAYLACFIDWSPYLVAGEVGHIVIVAADRRQCKTIRNYILAFIAGSALTAPLIKNETAEEITLTNGIVIEIATCSYKTIRGRTIVAALCEEAAFWADDSGANPASEVIRAMRPAMATVPGAMLLVISSRYRKQGPLWDASQRYGGKAGPILYWEAATRTMNPSLPQRVIDEAYETDPVGADSEYGIAWRSDVGGFIDRDIITALVVNGRREVAPNSAYNYIAFVDPSGGSADSMTLAIAFRDCDQAVLAALREFRPPFSPESVVAECASLLRSYELGTVTGDRYGGDWVASRFMAHGIQYQASERTKSDIYVESLPLLNAGRVQLLDNNRLLSQLCGLERRVLDPAKTASTTVPAVTMTFVMPQWARWYLPQRTPIRWRSGRNLAKAGNHNECRNSQSNKEYFHEAAYN